MNSSQYKRAIDKYLTNVVFRDTDFNYDIDVTYHDGHKKNIIMITIHIDLAKLLKNHPDFDEKYHDMMRDFVQINTYTLVSTIYNYMRDLMDKEIEKRYNEERGFNFLVQPLRPKE